jgi:hypothetical protein
VSIFGVKWLIFSHLASQLRPFWFGWIFFGGRVHVTTADWLVIYSMFFWLFIYPIANLLSCAARHSRGLLSMTVQTALVQPRGWFDSTWIGNVSAISAVGRLDAASTTLSRNFYFNSSALPA